MEEKLLADARSDDHQPAPAPDKVKVAETIAGLLMFAGLIVMFVVAFLLILKASITNQPIPDDALEISIPYPSPEISIVVDGCSSLDARVPRAFNFTVTIDNPGKRYEVCVGGDAVVLYGGVPLATGLVQDHCVPPHGAGEVVIRAASEGVGLPTELAARMAEERAGGVVQLEVRVISLEAALNCKAILGRGAGGAARPSPCRRPFIRDESDGVVRPLD